VWHVFVDTSAFFALTVVEDQNHIHTRELFAQAYRESWSLVTTNAVVAETHALILNRARPGREKALEFLAGCGKRVFGPLSTDAIMHYDVFYQAMNTEYWCPKLVFPQPARGHRG
jgi:predicted nucleic acid-binding protein